MGATDWSSREGHRLLQLGVLLLLLGLIVGFAMSPFVGFASAVPLLGLTAHVVGVLQGIFLIVLGLLWPRLRLTRMASGIGFWLAAYSCFVSWALTVLAGVWGAGGSVMPLAAGSAEGTAGQEMFIQVGFGTAAVAVFALAILMLWGLRAFASEQTRNR